VRRRARTRHTLSTAGGCAQLSEEISARARAGGSRRVLRVGMGWHYSTACGDSSFVSIERGVVLQAKPPNLLVQCPAPV